MSKIEKEVKVLDIDVDSVKERLNDIGAQYIDKKVQKIFVYDIPTLYYRFLEIRALINTDDEMLINTNIRRLEILLLEFIDLIDEQKLRLIEQELNIDKLSKIASLPISDIRDILNNKKLEDLFKNFMINPNKWLRLRQSNDKIELTSKHILMKKVGDFQEVIETEISVSSFDETKNLLDSIGLSWRSYQEKKRYSYKYKETCIEIDIWPKLAPYMEIECDDILLINEIINKLDLGDKEVVSLNTEQLYKNIGIDVHKISELKF